MPTCEYERRCLALKAWRLSVRFNHLLFRAATTWECILCTLQGRLGICGARIEVELKLRREESGSGTRYVRIHQLLVGTKESIYIMIESIRWFITLCLYWL